MFNIKTLFFIILSALLISCSSTEPFDQKLALQRWHKNQQELIKIKSFQVNGSIGYFSEKTRSFGRFLINQKSPNNYTVKITSPIGTNVLNLAVTPNSARLTDRDGNNHVGKNIDELVSKIAHINIPFNSLHNWLKGLSNSPDHDIIDAQGRLVSTKFIQNGNLWKLNISDYMQRRHNGKNIYLPETIELNTLLERFNLTISKWTLR